MSRFRGARRRRLPGLSPRDEVVTETNGDEQKVTVRHVNDRLAVFATVAALAALFLSVGTTYVGIKSFGRIEKNTARAADLKAEVAARVLDARRKDSQDCAQDEGVHKDEVEQLRGTYRFLKLFHGLGRTGDPLYRYVVANLPANERKALEDRAPDYCDRPNIGLPEPDPALPRRPAFLRRTDRSDPSR